MIGQYGPCQRFSFVKLRSYLPIGDTVYDSPWFSTLNHWISTDRDKWNGSKGCSLQRLRAQNTCTYPQKWWRELKLNAFVNKLQVYVRIDIVIKPAHLNNSLMLSSMGNKRRHTAVSSVAFTNMGNLFPCKRCYFSEIKRALFPPPPPPPPLHTHTHTHTVHTIHIIPDSDVNRRW